MSTKKYTDWRSWWDGLRTNLFKCTGTAGLTWIGTNGLSATTHIIKGIDWEQALGFFGVHIAFEVFTYMKTNQPQVITEEVNTAFASKDPATGATVIQSSSTKTTTPVQPVQPESKP